VYLHLIRENLLDILKLLGF